MNKNEIIACRDDIIAKHGEWIANISLNDGVTTRSGETPVASQRMVKVLNAAIDIGADPARGIRVLDLGTQEGVHAIEFARRGAQVVSVEGRESNFVKLEFAKKAIGLSNLQNLLIDINNVDEIIALGEFDFIICSGILYHLPKQTQEPLLRYMSSNSRIGFLVDSHFSFSNNDSFELDGVSYFGSTASEFDAASDDQELAKSVYKSIDAQPSFLISRASFVNLMDKFGVRSVYELFLPARSPSKERALVNRCCFVCVSGEREKHEGKDAASDSYPETELCYVSPRKLIMASKFENSLVQKILRILR